MTQKNVRILIFLSTTLVFLAAAGLLVATVAKVDRSGSLGVVYQADVSGEQSEQIARTVPIASGYFVPGRVLIVFQGSPAAEAGLQPGDQMLAVEGVPIADVERVREIDAAKRLGDEVRLRWVSGGETREAPVRLESPVRDFSLYFSASVSAAIALAFFLIGTLVLRARRHDRTALVFHILTSIGAAFFLAWALVDLYTRGERGILPGFSFQVAPLVIMAVYFVLGTMLSAALLHFSFIFPRPARFIERFPRVVALIYLAAPLHIAFTFAGFFIGDVRRLPWSAVVVVSLGLLNLALILRLLRPLRTEGWTIFGAHPLTTFATVWVTFLMAAQMVRLAPPVMYFVLVGLTFGAGIVLFSFGFPMISLGLVLLSYIRASADDKQQFRWPLLGLLFALGGILAVGVAGLIVGMYSGYSQDASFIYMQMTIQNAGKIFYLLIPVSFAFGILKYRLMEVDLVVRKTLVYSIVSAVVLVAYLFIVGVIGSWIIRWSGVQDQVVVIAATLLVAVVFIPMRNRVQTVVDRGFFRHRANLQKSMRELGARLSKTDDLGRMLQVVAEEVQSALSLQRVVVLAGDAGDKPKIAATAPAEAAIDGLMLAPLDRGLFQARAPLPHTALSLDAVTVALLEDAGIRRVCAPHADRGAVAVILAGEKLSEQPWDPDDDEYLATVAERMALSVESARLRMEEDEYRQAQSIQRSLLPRQIPQLESMKIAGFWQPSRAVGGDYYDAISLDSKRVAICVGDVVGKGMPAAILMSSLQAGIRALADSAVPPADVVARARRVVIPSLDRGKFITFFYGVLDESTREIRYTNAGHNPPILLRSDGTIERLEDGGPALARLFESAPYASAGVALSPGDRLVVFTDGLTEAEDVTKNQFGEEQVMRVMRENASATAAELQSALVTAALRHTGGTLQDDLTLVVVEVS